MAAPTLTALPAGAAACSSSRAHPAAVLRTRLLPHPTFLSTHGAPTLHRCAPICRTSDAAAAAVTSNGSGADRGNQLVGAPEVVDEVLRMVEGTDAGANLDGEMRRAIDAKLDALELVGSTQGPPLENPLVFGNYDVIYQSTKDRSPRACLRGSAINIDKCAHAAAGGRFRTGLGKAIFRTRALCQSVLPPNIVVNKVEFALFGFLPGYVGLRGTLRPEEGADERTVRVDFERPVIGLPGVVLRIGPPSWVVLATTYLDERVRLGKGSRGSLFVFKRGGASDAAGMDQVGLARTTPLGWVVLTAFLAGLVAAAGALIRTRRVLPALAGCLLGALAGGISYVLWRGGLDE